MGGAMTWRALNEDKGQNGLAGVRPTPLNPLAQVASCNLHNTFNTALYSFSSSLEVEIA